MLVDTFKMFFCLRRHAVSHGLQNVIGILVGVRLYPIFTWICFKFTEKSLGRSPVKPSTLRYVMLLCYVMLYYVMLYCYVILEEIRTKKHLRKKVVESRLCWAGQGSGEQTVMGRTR